MRTIKLNGYIDDEIWFGDEITPQTVHDALYQGEDGDDVQIMLNSYGGSCNAATQIYDEIRAYDGKVSITISGTAASAATVIAQAADKLTMTNTSLFMIHDPSTIAMGNEAEIMQTVEELKAVKESIINAYMDRCKIERDEVARMMKDTTWMDSTKALEYGFIDAIETAKKGTEDAEGERTVNKADAEKKVREWYDRHDPRKRMEAASKEQEKPMDKVPEEPVETAEITEEPVVEDTDKVYASVLLNRLRHIEH